MSKKSNIIILIVVLVIIIGTIDFAVTSKKTGSETSNGANLNLEESNQMKNPQNQETTPTDANTLYGDNIKVTIETSKGNITIELFSSDAPKTVGNFVKLAQEGFYDGVIFHRVISGFMIQGGDPTGTGRGGPGYTFEDELHPETQSYQQGYVRGTLAMANAGPNTNGSQFFIMHQDYPLPRNYTIFGRVLEGMETVDAIAAVPTDQSDKPKETITINSISISTSQNQTE